MVLGRKMPQMKEAVVELLVHARAKIPSASSSIVYASQPSSIATDASVVIAKTHPTTKLYVKRLSKISK